LLIPLLEFNYVWADNVVQPFEDAFEFVWKSHNVVATSIAHKIIAAWMGVFSPTQITGLVRLCHM